MTEARPAGYSGLQIGLHWTVAVLVVVQFLAHDGIEHAWRAFASGKPPEPGGTALVNLHIVVGLLIFVLALWRLWLRVTRGAPPLPANEPKSLKFAAHATHFLIYALIIGMPISGSVAWFGGVAPAAAAHVVAKNVLFFLVLLHIAGALFQRFFLKSDVLSRMMVPRD